MTATFVVEENEKIGLWISSKHWIKSLYLASATLLQKQYVIFDRPNIVIILEQIYCDLAGRI
jgi:hypothetical protein